MKCSNVRGSSAFSKSSRTELQFQRVWPHDRLPRPELPACQQSQIWKGPPFRRDCAGKSMGFSKNAGPLLYRCDMLLRHIQAAHDIKSPRTGFDKHYVNPRSQSFPPDLSILCGIRMARSKLLWRSA